MKRSEKPRYILKLPLGCLPSGDFWYVADTAMNNLNVTLALAQDIGVALYAGRPFTSRHVAQVLADVANGDLEALPH